MNSNQLCAYLIATLFFLYKLIELGGYQFSQLFFSSIAIPFWISLIAVILAAISIVSSKNKK